MGCKLEICAASYESAVAAQRGGAQRIELCSVLPVGGVTPSYGLISMVRSSISLEMNVLVRPRQGDFLYSSYEVEEVIRDISHCALLRVHGVVVGALDANGKVDRTICGDWLKEAHRGGMSATFHRAIDCSTDIMEALDEVMSLGYDRVLTSGGFPTAYEGMEVLSRMSGYARDKIIIMPGSGINPSNILEIIRNTGVREIHLSASTTIPSAMKKYGGIGTPETITYSDENIIRQTVGLLGGCGTTI